MALTKAQIKALIANATKVIQAEYPKATEFEFNDGETELTFRYYDKKTKDRWHDDGMEHTGIEVPVGHFDEEFPWCCGFRVLTNFQTRPTPLEKAAFTLAFHLCNWSRTAAVFATTANQPGADAMLLANGFELIHSGINPGTGNRLRAYIYKFPTTVRSRRK